jgi:hypothetical protein
LGRSILPGRLRVEARTVKRPDPKNASKVITRNFIVPVLDFDVDVAAVALAGLPMAGGEIAPLLPPAPTGLTPVPALAQPSLQSQLAEADKAAEPPKRRNSPPPLPRTGLAPRPVAAVRAAGDAPSTEQPPPQSTQVVDAPARTVGQMERVESERQKAENATGARPTIEDVEARVVTPPASANEASDEAAKAEPEPARDDALFPEDDEQPGEDDAERRATLYRQAAEQLPNLPVERRRDVSIAFGWKRGVGLTQLLDPLSTQDLDRLCQRISEEADIAERQRAAVAQDEAGDGA